MFPRNEQEYKKTILSKIKQNSNDNKNFPHYKIVNDILTGPLPYTNKKLDILKEEIIADHKVTHLSYGKNNKQLPFFYVFCRVKGNNVYFKKTMIPVMLLYLSSLYDYTNPLFEYPIFSTLFWTKIFSDITKTECTIDELCIVLKKMLQTLNEISPENTTLKNEKLFEIIKDIYKSEKNNNLTRKNKINYICKIIDLFFGENMFTDKSSISNDSYKKLYGDNLDILKGIKDDSIIKKFVNYGYKINSNL